MLRAVQGAPVKNLWGMMDNIGDCTAWARCAPLSLVHVVGPTFANKTAPRLFVGGQHFFGVMPGPPGGVQNTPYATAPGAPWNHTVDMHATLNSAGLVHVYNDSLDPGKHEWSSVWLR